MLSLCGALYETSSQFVCATIRSNDQGTSNQWQKATSSSQSIFELEKRVLKLYEQQNESCLADDVGAFDGCLVTSTLR